MPKQSDVKALVRWRDQNTGGKLTDEELRDSLSVESLCCTPARLLPSVTLFRHLRQDARLAAVRANRK